MASTFASRWTRVLVGVAAVALVSLALYGTHSAHFQHHTARQLATIASSDALRVDIQTKDASFAATALLFPRGNTSPDAGLVFDGRIVYELSGLTYNATIVDGRGYLTIENTTTREIIRNTCLSADDTPPLHLLTEALRNARVVDHAPAHGLSQADCAVLGSSRSKLVQFQFAGETYVLCSHADGRIDTVHGENVQFAFSRPTKAEVLTRSEILTRPGGRSVDECPPVTADLKVVSPATHESRVARALSQVVTRTQDAVRVVFHIHREAPSDSCATACKDGKKVCLLVHGLGQKASDALLVDSYFRTWGDAETKLHCCTETKVVRLDTIQNAWHSDVLATQFCEAAMALTGSDDPMALENIAVLSHSMGNLIVTSAAMKKRCAVGPSSKWIALAGPIRGSYGANLGVEVCGVGEGDEDSGVLRDTLVKTLSAVDVCPARNATWSLVFQCSDLTDAQLEALYEQAEATYGELVTSSMCGVSATGLPTIFSTWYSALGKLAAHTSPSDGAVEIDSCRGPFPESQFSTSWRGGRFYKAKLNHADVTMRNGDGLWGEDRQPIKWINCQF